MIVPNFQWNGDAVKVDLQAACWDGLRRATLFFWNSVQLAINKAYPPASSPGQPPRKRTGMLASGVQYELDKQNLTAQVGVTVNVRYGIFLELGTKRMLARPFMRSTLLAVLPQLRAIAESGKP